MIFIAAIDTISLAYLLRKHAAAGMTLRDEEADEQAGRRRLKLEK